MKKIRLANNKGFALIDDEDFEKINQYTWHITDKNAAKRSDYTNSKTPKSVLMHRQILNVHDPEIEVDHINHNRLDNQKSNLRLCNGSQNCANRIMKNNLKGIRQKGKKWQARIRTKGKEIHLGTFKTCEDAINVYNKKIKEIFGDFAQVNRL